MAKCACDTGLFNLQPASCLVKPGVTRKFIFVEYFKPDGTVNGVDLSQPFGETEIDALIANKDWLPTDSVSNFITDRADPNTEEIDNIAHITSQGPRTMSGDFLGSSAELSDKINANNCVEVGVFLIDEDNNITGIVNRDLFLDPIRLERNAFGKIVFPTESTIFKVSYSSTWQKTVQDGDVKSLTFADHETDILNKRGLVDVSERFAVSTLATTADITFATLNGSALGIPFTGLEFGDFVMRNETTDMVVAVTASVENPDGTYELTFASQTTNDIGTITATSTGFEFETGDITYL